MNGINPHIHAVLLALAELGQREVKGDADNPRIVALWQRAKIPGFVTDDETAYCAAGVGACLEGASLKGSRKGNAKSYLDWGQPIAAPIFGCVAVLNRANDPAGKGWQGHTAFVVGWSPSTIRLLGANQNDQWSIADFAKSRVCSGGYRWAIDVPFIDGTYTLPVSVGANPGDR